MASTILKPHGEYLAALADDITLSNGVAVTGYWGERRDFDSIPAVAVEPPDGRRSELDAGERELGSDDWLLDYQVALYVALDDAVEAQEQATELLEAYIAAVDADPSLGSAVVDDCKVTSWQKFTRLTSDKPLYGFELTVAVWRRVPYY